MTGKGKILVVDDTPTSLKLLTGLLKTEGYEVRSALDGELALKAAGLAPPDLVLLDIRMPVMDGYEVCRRLKADPVTRDVPVIFVSAASEQEEKVFGFKVGAVDYVTKPYHRDELLARVRTHIELNHLRNHLQQLVDERTASLNDAQRLVHAGNWELDLAGNKRICSEEMFRIFEIDPAQLGVSDAAILERIHPGDRDKVNASHAESLKHPPMRLFTGCKCRMVASSGWTNAANPLAAQEC